MTNIILRCNNGRFEVLEPNSNGDDVTIHKFINYEEALILALECSSKLGLPVQNQHLVCEIDK